MNNTVVINKKMKVYLWIISFLKPYKLQMFFFIIIGLFVAASEVAIPMVIQYLVDNVLLDRNSQLLILYTIVFILVVAFMIACTASRNILERHIAENSSRDLQYRIIQKIRELGFPYFENNSSGEILSILNSNVSDVQRVYRMYFPRTVHHLFIVLIIFGILAFNNFQFILIIVPCFLTYYIFGPYLERKAFFYQEKFATERNILEKMFYENMSSMEEVRATGSKEWMGDRFKSLFQTFNKSYITFIFFAFLRGTNRRFSLYLALLILFVYGVYLVIETKISVGEFISLYFYFQMLMTSLTMIITNITEQQSLMYQAERLYNIEKQPPTIKENNKPISLKEPVKGHISFQNVNFSYLPSIQVIKNFNLDIAAGEHIGIIGESGCGKTTLFKLIGRFYEPQLGQILIDGIPINQFSFKELRESIGYVFQETYLFDGSIRDNILFGKPDATEEEVLDAARKANADEFIQELPKKYDTFIGERGHKLSGGQKQRIAIARMFIKNPIIMLLDEATSSLDNIGESKVQEALEKLTKDRTTITIAHRLTTVENCNRIILMEKGEIVKTGNYNSLLQESYITS